MTVRDLSFDEEDTKRMTGEKAHSANGLDARVARLERDADRLYDEAAKLNESLRAVLLALGDMKTQLANATRVFAAAKHLQVPAWLTALSLTTAAGVALYRLVAGM